MIFLSKAFLPTPFDKLFVFVQAMALGIGTLLIRRFGATFVAVIGAMLTTIWRPSFVPFSLIFAILYGILIDSLVWGFRAKDVKGNPRKGRFVAAIVLSTAIVGLVTYYVSVFVAGVLPQRPFIELGIPILVGGTISGAVGAYLAISVWRRIVEF